MPSEEGKQVLKLLAEGKIDPEQAYRLLKAIGDVDDKPRSEPFEPFTIKLTNGETFEVTHALQVAISPEGTGAVFLHPKRGVVHFRKNQVVSVHVNEAQET